MARRCIRARSILSTVPTPWQTDLSILVLLRATLQMKLEEFELILESPPPPISHLRRRTPWLDQ
jgi:hypothetical protein